ncbi:hypothetical protein M8818_002449 [Zalaria obscura]|uniref:Uncharacterized protein n=1 Tax=Zalaria obscura TaxID=2024903 RepID=A0ACC3SJR4_9PEZI
MYISSRMLWLGTAIILQSFDSPSRSFSSDPRSSFPTKASISHATARYLPVAIPLLQVWSSLCSRHVASAEKVERSGLLRRNVTVNHILTFRPLSPPRAAENEPPMFVTSASSLAGSALGLTDAIPGSLSPSSLPPYTPSIFLEASMMSPLVVRPGDRVRLNLKLAIPQELLESVGELWLTSLSIRFSTTCTARVGLISKQKQTYTAICSTAGNLPIDTKHGNGRLMLPPALWESYRYPMALASFRTLRLDKPWGRPPNRSVPSVGSGTGAIR